MILLSTAPADHLDKPLGHSHTTAGKIHTPTITIKHAESYSIVPHSMPSHSAAGDTVVLPTSKTVMHHTEKSIGPTSHITERSQVADNDNQSNAGVNITKDTISES